MNLKDIATISGKGGLFKLVKPTRSGVILESIDEQKSKIVAGSQFRVSLLKEISIYTTGKESSVALEDVLNAIYAKYGKQLPVQPKTSSPEELAQFLESVVPNYDRERVYASDTKKLVSWYSILITHMPELFENKEEKAEQPEAEEKKS